MVRPILLLALPLLCATAQAASPPLPRSRTILAHAPDTAWRTIPGQDLVVLDLPRHQQVLIELAPDLAPAHVARIRARIRLGAWTGGSIERVQENYVVQFAEHEPAPKLPPLPNEDSVPASLRIQTPLGFPDPYARDSGFKNGWPLASDGHATWAAQCYGTVGVGRDMPPDTGDATELYAPIGEAPRQLDRNLAVVGRIVSGMSALTTLPRGTAPLGFYATAAEHTPILRATLASDLPAASRPRLQTLKTETPTFEAYLAAIAHRTEPFFTHAAAGIALCNVAIPTRPVPTHPPR